MTATTTNGAPSRVTGPAVKAVPVPEVMPLPTIGAEEIFAAPVHIQPAIPALHAIVGRPTLVYGLPAVGKSIVLEDAFVAAAVGQPWLGHDAAPMRALWLDGEVGLLTKSRVQRIARARGVGPAEIGDRLRLAIFPELSLDDPKAEKKLVATCAGFGVVFVDSLSALSGETDENSPDVGKCLLMLGRVSTRTGAAFVVLHHARRDGEIRGSTSIKAGSESHWRMVAHGRSITMVHERSPIGDLRPDLHVRIRDVAIGDDALGGLAVEAEADARAAAATRSLEREIVDYLTKHGGFAGGVDSFATALARKDVVVRDAVKALEQDGVIVRSGKSQSTRLDLRGAR